MKKAKWGYLGTETAINGLTEWLYNNTDIKNSVESAADAVAKAINQKENKKELFQSFTAWVLKQQS